MWSLIITDPTVLVLTLVKEVVGQDQYSKTLTQSIMYSVWLTSTSTIATIFFELLAKNAVQNKQDAGRETPAVKASEIVTQLFNRSVINTDKS